jgi:hypothetical protein
VCLDCTLLVLSSKKACTSPAVGFELKALPIDWIVVVVVDEGFDTAMSGGKGWAALTRGMTKTGLRNSCSAQNRSSNSISTRPARMKSS